MRKRRVWPQFGHDASVFTSILPATMFFGRTSGSPTCHCHRQQAASHSTLPCFRLTESGSSSRRLHRGSTPSNPHIHIRPQFSNCQSWLKLFSPPRYRACAPSTARSQANRQRPKREVEPQRQAREILLAPVPRQRSNRWMSALHTAPIQHYLLFLNDARPGIVDGMLACVPKVPFNQTGRARHANADSCCP